MELKAFLKSLGDDTSREQFAASCETTHGHMKNCIYVSGKLLAPATCVLVEVNSKRKVMRWDLRPDDWHLIWPELVGRKGSPTPEPVKA